MIIICKYLTSALTELNKNLAIIESELRNKNNVFNVRLVYKKNWLELLFHSLYFLLVF